ncbi:MAG: 6,7-dimethyl-8-ribityllumazine synthase [Cyclobacteriaceae bacterium]|nr:6,7-dimethyl-8-ribityllumazine synthase [Cyclobacteriaceae bacterium]
MAGILKSGSGKSKIDLSNKRFAIVVAEWNEDITEALYEGAVSALTEAGAKKKHVVRHNVPGSFELTLGAQWMTNVKNIDAVICLGCVIQGDTPHFDYICQAVANGITSVNLSSNKPVIFGVLTTLNKTQALERAGGKLGNKGEEAAVTAIKMLELKDNIK